MRCDAGPRGKADRSPYKGEGERAKPLTKGKSMGMLTETDFLSDSAGFPRLDLSRECAFLAAIGVG